jgi:beta-xylosidase
VKAIYVLINTLFFVSVTLPAIELIEFPTEKNNMPLIWQADLENGYYQNPIIHADFSDPDIVAQGDDYYMTASSFNSAPGLPILHSNDLVNWQLINYALPIQQPREHYNTPQHGNGVWAPNIRYHNGLFWIFYPDPDFGIYVITAKDPAKAWSTPTLILKGKGIIDPTPLWDDDGKAYLLHAWAKSRAGFNNVLSIREMSADASWVSDEYQHIVDGNTLPSYRTLEGPKFYKRNGFYYIFAPAGGVDLGWQSVFRSKHILGPYEDKIVMAQGNSLTNGPHQGSWINTPYGQDWFVHFQSKNAYGRIVHLQPLQWLNDWPVIGRDPDKDGIGEPVLKYRKPKAKRFLSTQIPNSDEFNAEQLGLQWQWNANPQPHWFSLTDSAGYLTLSQQQKVADSLWLTPSLLLQKLPAERFFVETKLVFNPETYQGDSGLLLFGEDYAWIGISRSDEGALHLIYSQCKGARKGCTEHKTIITEVTTETMYLRLLVQPGAHAVFSYKTSEASPYRAIGEHFSAKKGRWVGAKVGLFNVNKLVSRNSHSVHYDYIRFSKVADK